MLSQRREAVYLEFPEGPAGDGGYCTPFAPLPDSCTADPYPVANTPAQKARERYTDLYAYVYSCEYPI